VWETWRQRAHVRSTPNCTELLVEEFRVAIHTELMCAQHVLKRVEGEELLDDLYSHTHPSEPKKEGKGGECVSLPRAGPKGRERRGRRDGPESQRYNQPLSAILQTLPCRRLDLTRRGPPSDLHEGFLGRANARSDQPGSLLPSLQRQAR
jgi:hypothetical protein